jgi:UDP-glucuronate 4-epimerase
VRASAPDERCLTFIEGDIRDRELLDRVFAEYAVDAVAHLAAMAGVRVSVENPYLYYDVNLTGTLALLDAARQRGLRTFVLASTSSVYGQTGQIPFVETDPCDRPLAPYAASKRAAEMLGFTYHHLYGQNVTVLRFFTVYGPRGRPDMMAYKVLDNIFSGVEVPIYSAGQMHRDWTYIDDIVAGVIAAIDQPLGYEIINLGRGQPVLLAEFVRLIEVLVGHKAQLVPAPMPETDISYTYADIAKARALLGYEPEISVTEGVRRFCAWYQQAVLADGQPSESRSEIGARRF